MRIQRLDLFAFGTFSNARLDFSHKPDALQLVYGPNEAGKSTTLRALISLLFGIPARTTDAHIHDMTRLRIGATFRDERGQQLTVVRRKGLKQTLLDTEGQPLPDSALSDMLAGLSEPLFRNMFGLDHERLREGAEALLKGGGHLGEGLFDASVGSRALRDLKESLSSEAEELYKPRGKTPKLNQALEVLREKTREKKDSALSPAAFVEQQRALTDKREQRTIALAQRRELLSEQARIGRTLQLLPLLARHDRLLAQLREQPQRAGEVGLLGTDLLEDQIRELERRYGVVLSAESDLPSLRNELASLERERALLRARIGVGNMPSRTIDTPLRTRLRKLSQDHQRAGERLVTLRKDAAQLMRESELWVERARSLRPTGTAHELSALLQTIENESLLLNLTRGQGELQKRAALIERALAQLALSFEVVPLAQLALPDERVLLELEQGLDRCATTLRNTRQREQELLSKQREHTQRRASLLARGTPVSARELSAAREARDTQLATLHQQLDQPSLEPLSAGLAVLGTHIVHSDQLADRMRAEVRQASELVHLDSELTALQQELDAVAKERAEAHDEQQSLRARLTALLAPIGLAIGEPRELRGKLLKLQTLREQASDLLNERAAHTALQERAQALATQLRKTLEQRGEPCPESLELAPLVAFARAYLTRFQEQAREADALEAKAHEARARATAFAANTVECQAEQTLYDQRFREQLTELGFQSSLSADELFACLDDISAALLLDGKIDALKLREHELGVQSQALTRDVTQLIEKVLPPLVGELLPAQLEALVRAQRAQREQVRDKARWQEELDKLSEELQRVGDGVSIVALKEQAQQAEPSALRARLIEIESALSKLDEEISDVERELGGLEAGLSMIAAAPHAVAVAEEVEGELSNVRALLRRYLEVRLSQSILTREVERYRQQHQGPLLSRAAELFVRLTLKNYEGLSVEFDEHDEPVLCAVHKTQRHVRVAGLSDGTRDQLYLALRIASLERFLVNNRALPLVLDDAFIHFDDARAEAALSVLGELSKRTQVLFFTHHLRMIELVKRALKPAQVALHELDPVRGTVSYRDDGPLFARL